MKRKALSIFEVKEYVHALMAEMERFWRNCNSLVNFKQNFKVLFLNYLNYLNYFLFFILLNFYFLKNLNVIFIINFFYNIFSFKFYFKNNILNL
jgi:hypothetical protein